MSIRAICVASSEASALSIPPWLGDPFRGSPYLIKSTVDSWTVFQPWNHDLYTFIKRSKQYWANIILQQQQQTTLMDTVMFYLLILFFCQVSIWILPKRLHFQPFKFLQVRICYLNTSIGYCIRDKLRCIIIEHNFRVLHIIGIRQTKSFLQYQIQKIQYQIWD